MMLRTLNRWLAVTVTAAVLAGCAATKPLPAPHVYAEGLDVTAMQQVLKRGLDEIKTRAYDDPNLDDLFNRAVVNLQSLDAATSFTPAGKDVTIARDGIQTRVPVVYGDSSALTTALIDTVVAARRQSPEIKGVDAEAIYNAIFPPMLAVIDPYSRYAPRMDASARRLLRVGVIGLGLEVRALSVGASVNALVIDGPAAKAGVKPSDIIVKVDGRRIARKSLRDIRRMLDGSNDTLVKLDILRSGERKLIQIVVKRDLIVPDTATLALTDGIAELRVRSFNQRTGRAVSRLVADARKANGGTLKGIVLDMRGDSGGLLDQAIEMSDLFLDTGIIAILKGRHPGAQQFYAAHSGDIADGAPMVILTDARTASAAEIVAAALQDNGRAVVVGTESLGKGSVQSIIGLPNGGELSITWAHVTTPRGTLLHGLGILPDVCLMGDDADARPFSSQTALNFAPSAETRHQWTTAGLDVELRRNLRMACPPQSNPERATEMDIARSLLRDPVLMARVAMRESAQLAVRP